MVRTAPEGAGQGSSTSNPNLPQLSSSHLQNRQVAVDFVSADVYAVIVPLNLFIFDELEEDMVPQRLP